ncbi:MAG: hypothetical protein K2W96_10180 [Gemmataceae bacterium]|nr:hypothetical protein [Gemmataceae bacterium]
MAFKEFKFPDVITTLGLTLTEVNLFPGVPPLEPPADFIARLRDEVPLAVGIDTEKARSEYIVAPLLSQLRRLLHGGFGLFSGVEFDVDSERGLNGYCDFILTRSPLLTVLTAPVVAIAEAKNDNTRTGLGQCIAAMVAAREFNARVSPPIPTVHGATTTGTAWKFLRLTGSALALDATEYYITEPARILGILAHILTTS